MHITDFKENGWFDPQKVADVLRTSPEEVAMTAGLSKDMLQNLAEIRSDDCQRHLREMAEVLDKLTPRFGSPLIAYAWYRSKPLPGFGGRTAMQVVQEGKAQRVLNYVDALDAGVYV